MDDAIQNDDHAGRLRYLRAVMGVRFRPISTTALAKLTNIDHTAIRSVEANRRRLNDRDLAAIKYLLGAVWDPELHQWVCIWQEKKGEKLPFNRQRYEQYSSGPVKSVTLTETNAPRLGNAIQELGYNLEPGQTALFFDTIHDVIVKFAEQSKANTDLIESLRAKKPDLRAITIKEAGRDEALKDLETEPSIAADNATSLRSDTATSPRHEVTSSRRREVTKPRRTSVPKEAKNKSS